MRTTTRTLLAALALLAAACGDTDDPVTDAAQEAGDAAEQAEAELEGVDSSAVVEQLRAEGLETLASAVEAVGVENVVTGESFTIFAPRDEAWLALDPDALTGLLSDPAQAGEVLQSHVVGETLSSEDLAGMGSVETASGRTLTISSTGSGVTVDDAAVVEPDIEVGGGVVHVVDSVLATDLIGSGTDEG